MASSCSILALDSAGRLDRALAVVAGYVDDLRDLLRGDPRASLLVHSLAVAIVHAQQVRKDVLLTMDATSTKVSLDAHERALRARLNIAVRSLYALKSGEAEIPSTAFVGRFHALRDVSVHLTDRLAQIHTLWTEQRAMHERLDAWTQQLFAYQALDDAEIAFERIGRESDLEHFLHVGAASACEPVSLACRELAATVGLALAPVNNDADLTQPAARSVDRTAS